MGTTDVIAAFIAELLRESEGSAELRRAEIADRFNCVPSQINYVIATRFSPEHGYAVESRRGGGGYIRITRVATDPERMVMHTVNAVGNSIDAPSAAALIGNMAHHGAIDERTARIILAAVSPSALRDVSHEDRSRVRATILKQILVNLV